MRKRSVGREPKRTAGGRRSSVCVRWLDSTKQPPFLVARPRPPLSSPPSLSRRPKGGCSDEDKQCRTAIAMERSLDGCSSIKDVTYSCGYCGYELNLSSSARNTANIGSKYGKQIKKGVVSFFAVDESRFTQTDDVGCVPYFHSKRSWGLFRRRSRLLCRKCGGRIGTAYEEEDPALSACDGGSDDMRTSSGSSSSTSSQKNYVIKINALQPSLDDSAVVPFTL